MRVQRDRRRFTVEVSADGDGLVSHAGSGLLAELADRSGLTSALSRGLARVRERRSGHDPGRVVRDLAVMLADGGDCLADLRALRDQASLFGPVASGSTAFRVIERIASEPELTQALRSARAAVRERTWQAGGRPEQIVIDLDATLVTAHSEKEGAAGTFKRGFGLHPLLAYLDESAEPLAGMLRPGNAGANTACDQIAVAGAALEQLPRGTVEEADILLRADSAGATHELLDWARAGRIRFSVGFDITEPVRQASSHCPSPPSERRSARTATTATAPGSQRSLTASISRAGPRAPARSCAVSVPTLARSSPSPITAATASRSPSPTSKAQTSQRSSGATAPVRTSRTASATPSRPVSTSCRSATSSTTPSGSSSCSWPRTCSAGPSGSCSTESSPVASPSA